MVIVAVILIFFLVPYGMAQLFNRIRPLSKHKWLSYISSIIALIIVFFWAELIDFHYGPHQTQFQCRLPMMFLPILFSPLVVLLQYLCNLAIVKSEKFED